jgi:hypothetical protein
MALTYVEADRLPGKIGETIAAADRLYNSMAATDAMLALIQDKLYSGDEDVYNKAIIDVRRGIADYHDQVDGWKIEVDRLEKERTDLRSLVIGLPPGERGRPWDRLDELRREIDTIRARMIMIDNRITDMLDRVLYITERH